MLQTLMGYSATKAGFVLCRPPVFVTMLLMPIVGTPPTWKLDASLADHHGLADCLGGVILDVRP